MEDSAATSEYAEFVRRIRDGDEHAAEELVRRYEPEIRLEVRGWLRLRNPSLRRVFDSMDICQSVLASFFTRAAFGEFDLEEPSQVIRLLVGMARKKVAEQARYHQRQRRDVPGSARVTCNRALPPRPTKPPAVWCPGASCCKNSANVCSTRSAELPTCGHEETTGRPWPPSWGERPTLAVSNWPARSHGSSKSWALTCFWIECGDNCRGRDWPSNLAGRGTMRR